MNQTVHSYTTDTPENISNKFTYTLCRQFDGEAKNPKKSLGNQMVRDFLGFFRFGESEKKIQFSTSSEHKRSTATKTSKVN